MNSKSDIPQASTIHEIATSPQAYIEFSEDALAQELISKHQHRLRYVASMGKWLIYNGTVWKYDKTLKIFSLTREICTGAARKAKKLGENPNRLIKLASAPTIYSVEKLARSDRRIAAISDQFDTHPSLLNTPDHVVDLRKGTKRAHRPDDYFTKITAVSPSGDCPRWMEFLDCVTAGDKELQAFLQRIAGYALTGEIKEHALFFIYGTGRNGKGVFINTLTNIINDFATTASMDILTTSRFARHSTELAMLNGARFVTAQETEEGKAWAESRVKALTGGDPITARFMRQDDFTYLPQFTLVISGNHKPKLHNVDEAMRSRVNLIPFTVTIPAEEQDKDLAEKLKDEWPGILQWACIGAKDWYENGLQVPTTVSQATQEYMSEEDSVESWIKECCSFYRGSTATATDLFESYKNWCRRSGEDEGTLRRLTSSLRDKYPELDDTWQCSTTRRTGFKGISVTN